MARYALLMLPSANRVYADSAVDLTLGELQVFNLGALGGRLGELAPEEIAGVGYVTFSADQLTPDDLAYLGNASAAYALFEVTGDGLLRPLSLPTWDQFDDDLVSIPKYPGKTNEQFTKLLLNVTLLAAQPAGRLLTDRLRVLDPLCGRGTTLNQVLTYGHNAAGIDLDGKDFEAYSGYVQTYLKRKRLKHRVQAGPVRRERKVVAKRMLVTVAPTRERHQTGDTLTLDVVNADTVNALDFFAPDSVDAIVTDAPYGVQHGSRTVTKGLRRGPLDLLTEAVPVWARLLRRGGSLGISWNTHVARRDEIGGLLTEAGLDVLDDSPFTLFRHRVDQAITRDILVARKPLASG